ncbi:hypothetical protein HMPREF9473_04842, partial [, partial [Hungatella hathewayi WAL-18680]
KKAIMLGIAQSFSTNLFIDTRYQVLFMKREMFAILLSLKNMKKVK